MRGYKLAALIFSNCLASSYLSFLSNYLSRWAPHFGDGVTGFCLEVQMKKSDLRKATLLGFWRKRQWRHKTRWRKHGISLATYC